ncbi:MAG: aldo/keto reductase [Bacteroidales bacterium]|nr:aldo/keto reductase [Fournierella massiliensis]MCF2556857.1 aldo/keto reductase [Fournierella massiliensis]MCI6740593.1 aldo/keto reductase [Bacteroidales bacterium]
MNHRMFGKTGRRVSEIGLGTWQLGARWGDPFDEAKALEILQAGYECGIDLIDTADIYNNGGSERAIGKFLARHRDHFFVVTKCGRGLDPHTAEGYTPENTERFIDQSLERLGMEQLDLVLLHCPPSSVYQKDELFAGLDKLVQKGKIAHYGVSIEKVSEGLRAMEYPISAIEVIFNMFRLKPAEELFPAAQARQISILARVPLASGLLTGRYTKDTRFGQNDHRSYNRNGEAFDKGETFSGVDYEQGLRAVAELKKLFGTEDLIPYALRWILMQEAVSAVIPGASRPEQVRANVKAAQLPALSPEQMEGVRAIYDRYIRASVHPNW